VSIDNDLARWRDAGLIDKATADSIRSFERERSSKHEERPGVSEALVYLGLAAVTIGAFVLGALLWDELTFAARLAVLLVVGLVLGGFGVMLTASDSASLKRGGSVALFAAVPLLAGAAATVFHEADLAGERTFLLTGVVAASVAMAAWVYSPRSMQVLALGPAIAFASIGLVAEAVEGDAIGENSALAFSAGLLAVIAAAWLVLTEIEFIRPLLVARILGAVALTGSLYVGSFHGDLEALFEVLVILAAGVLVAIAVWRGVFEYIAIGVAALFLGGVTIILKRVPDPAIGALVLILAGALLIGAVLLLARWKPWRRAEAGAVR
jgi:hypothetical protein